MFRVNRIFTQLSWYSARDKSSGKMSVFQMNLVDLSQWRVFAIPVTISVILRFYQLSTESLWIDEILSYEDGLSITSKVFDNLSVRPLYYLLLRVWMFGGLGDAWLRSFSILLDLGAMTLAYRLCHDVFGRRVAFLTTLMMALSPLLINHAQEIRMYPLINVFTLGGSLALAQALSYPTQKRIGIWAIMRLLGIFTSPLMLLMILPDTLLYGFKYWRRWSQLRLFVYGLLLIAFTWMPLALNSLFQATGRYATEHSDPHSFSIPVSEILALLTNFTVHWPLIGLSRLSTPLPLLYYKFFTLLLVFILMVALFKIRLSPNNNVLWITSWAFLPGIVHFLGSELFLSGSLFTTRYFLYLSPYIIMLLAYGFERILIWQPKIAVLVAIFYFVAVSGGLAQYYTQLYRNDWQGVADTVEAMEQPGDVVVNFTLMGHHSFPRYYEGNSSVTTIHIPRRLAPCSITEPTSEIVSPGDASCLDERADIVQASLSQLPKAERLWIVCFAGCHHGEDYKRITTTVLGATVRETSQQRFDAISQHDFEAVELHLIEAIH